MYSIDNFLESDSTSTSNNEFDRESDTQHDVAKLAEFTGIDPRILNLSYSSRNTLHSCPQKYQLYKLSANTTRDDTDEETITFAYGHCVGLGIQLALEGKPYDVIIWRMFLEWKADLWNEDKKRNKSFPSAVFAVQKFIAMCAEGYLSDYELVTYNGKPACELSFLIVLPNGFKYRGYVDAVLRNKETDQVVVLECKTTAATFTNPGTYRNSAQAVGYSIVLDAIFPALSSYEVLYLVYNTKSYSYQQYTFNKSYVQRARWIRELVLDCDQIVSYEHSGIYPMHGESCVEYNKDCKYMGICTMSTDRIAKLLTEKKYKEMQEEWAEFQITVTLEDLINKQLEKAES